MIKVWIVDDDQEMINAIRPMVKYLACEEQHYLGARPAALALLGGGHPDFFILDINMPEVSGLDFLEFIRCRKDFKDLPVVMLSTKEGDVMVDKAMAMGADAYVTKPVGLGELEKAIKKALGAHDKKRLKIWIVDDDQDMVGAIRLMVKLLDCEERHFFSARPAALALLGGERPDLFILDINMPEVSGLDLLEFIRRRKDLKNLPVVMLSTEAADVMVDKAIAIGADAYVTKPVSLEELEKAIKKALGAHGKNQV
jgi:CheY-like chemotaxis protein